MNTIAIGWSGGSESTLAWFDGTVAPNAELQRLWLVQDESTNPLQLLPSSQ
jgi:hypothetical protein